MGGALGLGGCCYRPGHSKLAALVRLAGDGLECEEVGAGYNREDECETAEAQKEILPLSSKRNTGLKRHQADEG